MGSLTFGAATTTRVWQAGVSRLFSASCLDKQRPTAPMDQMPLFLLGFMLAFWQIWVTSSSHTPARLQKQVASEVHSPVWQA